MNAVENDVRVLVGKELAAANKQFPQFHSWHEGYAVILEEMEELKEEVEKADSYLAFAWGEIRIDDDCEDFISGVERYAINAACEAIQVAAMCKKFLEMEAQHDN